MAEYRPVISSWQAFIEAAALRFQGCGFLYARSFMEVAFSYVILSADTVGEPLRWAPIEHDFIIASSRKRGFANGIERSEGSEATMRSGWRATDPSLHSG